jgi:hypothetical protein
VSGAPLELLLGESSLVHGLILVVITMSAGIAALIHNYVEKLALIPQVRMYEATARTYRRDAAKLNYAACRLSRDLVPGWT